MKCLKRGTFVAAMAVAASAGLFAGSASATISPSDYSTTSGYGRLDTSHVMGPGSCIFNNVAARAAGSTAAVVTGFAGGSCAGTLVNIRFAGDIAISTPPGSVTANVVYEVDTALTSTCQYAGTLTGSASGGATQVIRGGLTLVRVVSGICRSGGTAQLTVTLPGATFS